MFGFDVGGFVAAAVFLAVVIPLVITGAVIGVIVWTIRRSMPTGNDAAIAQLRKRFAAGEIDMSEFQARVDILTRET